MTRRRFLALGAATAGVALLPEVSLLAQQARDFIEGPPVADIAPNRLSQRVWHILSPDGFPTPENRGMMSNVGFAVTSAGVVILDSGSSLQIGQMAIRMIRKVTEQPVVAIFNSHFHGDIGWATMRSFASSDGNCPFMRWPTPRP
jgi:glyoxylase-like metal-dependent hydrolase (beta-lactamase superfamily II)